MMWICKFDPYVGNMTQGLFKTPEAAAKVYRDASTRLENETARDPSYLPFSFKDDYGFAFTINLANHAIVLMELEQSVKMEGVLQKEVEEIRQRLLPAGQSSTPQGFMQQNPGLVRPQ